MTEAADKSLRGIKIPDGSLRVAASLNRRLQPKRGAVVGRPGTRPRSSPRRIPGVPPSPRGRRSSTVLGTHCSPTLPTEMRHAAAPGCGRIAIIHPRVSRCRRLRSGAAHSGLEMQTAPSRRGSLGRDRNASESGVRTISPRVVSTIRLAATRKVEHSHADVRAFPGGCWSIPGQMFRASSDASTQRRYGAVVEFIHTASLLHDDSRDPHSP
jgi:hypothetical protein